MPSTRPKIWLLPPINKKLIESLFSLNEQNLIIKITPAVTRVEECTSAEIGVGAAMAAGSQEENGNWALFVTLTIKRSKKGINDRASSSLSSEASI